MSGAGEGEAWSVHVTAAGGADAELAADALWAAGAAAVEERPLAGGDVLLVAGRADGGDPEPLLAAVAGRWPAEAVPVDLGAALDAWRDHARAVTAGRFTVRPPWVAAAPPAGGIELVVDPGRAFGSGSHASTRLALRALGEVVAGGEAVVDVGCGSGVLAVAALAAGAARAVAADVDPAALAATRANAERNGVADRLTVVGDVDDVPAALGPAADVVVANILAPVLVELAPAVRRLAAPGGAIVLSGLLAPQAPAVLAAYAAAGPADPAAAATPTVEAEAVDDGWLALTLRVGREPSRAG